MKNRVSRCAALIGTVLSLSSFAQVCNEVILYKGGESGVMEAGNTFPESPEWNANWGNMGTLVPPYIRISGAKASAGDWSGTMVLDRMPVNVPGGNLSLDLSASRSGKVGVWLEGDFGVSAVHYVNVSAGVPDHLEIPVASIVGSAGGLVQRIGVGLYDVPANSYETLFLDNIAFSCAVGVDGMVDGDSDDESRELVVAYSFSDVVPASPRRETRFRSVAATETSAAYDSVSRVKIADSTNADFVLAEQEHLQIQNFMESAELTPEESRRGWFNSMYLIERNRLRDSAMANPKALFYEAAEFTAGYDNRVMPVLVGNVDYAYRVCADTSCEVSDFESGRALLAGLPSSEVSGSVLEIYYDPYFIATNRSSIPTLEIHDGKRWVNVPLKSKVRVEFDSAGKNSVSVRLADGDMTVTQNIAVEVK
ncbi:hypothetical protein [Fibrobacter sp. HC4]|uniref:hypothetical protein n=1 Tax=Fibrobacter sp. HC4 TaxID=3239812 RepID=UPI0020189944|nr:hypothetical protein [Fibrobacter succinogenes]MCL4101685.1 hypothetical protein [Fibrobacter succinogenes]